MGALGVGSLNLVRQAHEPQTEVRVIALGWPIAVLAEFEHYCGRLEAGVDQHRVRVRRKLNILNCHAHEEERQVLNLAETAGVVLIAIWVEALAHDMDIGLMDVIGSDEVHLEGKLEEELVLSCEDLLLRESSMRDLLGNDFGVKRVNVFVL